MKKLIPITALVLGLLVMSTTFAGRIPGPGHSSKVISAGSSVTYTETFRGGQLARVSISGNGRTDVDVFVYDSFGNRIVSGVGLSDRETVTWIPSRTKTYRIVVRNLGSTWNRVLTTTN